MPVFTIGEQDLDSPFFFVSHFAVDADGAPNAYHPDDTGLDALRNAGGPGHWWALVTDDDGDPVIQRDFDPAPGYFVSTTALEDFSVSDIRDPDRYVDSTTIPYISLPPQALRFAHLGDIAMVINLTNGKSAGAIIADVGPRRKIGEGSIALARELDIDPDARRGGAEGNILYVIFPGSGDGTPADADEIRRTAEQAFKEWGGTRRAFSCTEAGIEHTAATP